MYEWYYKNFVNETLSYILEIRDNIADKGLCVRHLFPFRERFNGKIIGSRENMNNFGQWISGAFSRKMKRNFKKPRHGFFAERHQLGELQEDSTKL
jgi:hypothetical protein